MMMEKRFPKGPARTHLDPAPHVRDRFMNDRTEFLQSLQLLVRVCNTPIGLHADIAWNRIGTSPSSKPPTENPT